MALVSTGQPSSFHGARAQGGQLIARTSNLLHQGTALTGHKGAVLACQFSPSGDYIASGSADGTLMLWNVFGEVRNMSALRGHTVAVLDVCWTACNSFVIGASSDCSVSIWDTTVGKVTLRLKKPHRPQAPSIVNACCAARFDFNAFATATDGGTTAVHDLRLGYTPATVIPGEFPSTSVVFSSNDKQLFIGDVGGDLRCYNIAAGKVEYTLQHPEIISGLAINKAGTHLMTNCMDNAVRIFDIRPFVEGGHGNRLAHEGASLHGPEKNLIRVSWSCDDAFCAAGSATGSALVYSASLDGPVELSGHRGAVNSVHFHPTQPILISGSNDQTLFLGELPPPE